MAFLAIIVLSFFKSSFAVAQTPTKTLWDSWYAVRLRDPKSKKNLVVEIYEDKVESSGSKITFTNKTYKSPSPQGEREEIEATCEDNEDLSPLNFSYRLTVGESAFNSEGKVAKKGSIRIRTTKQGREIRLTDQSLARGTFLSSLFPIWLQKQIPKLQFGKKKPFLALIEDSTDQGYSTSAGMVQLEKPDAYARSTTTLKLKVEFRGVKALWWVHSNGMPQRISIPSLRWTIDKTTEEEARKAFGTRKD